MELTHSVITILKFYLVNLISLQLYSDFSNYQETGKKFE